MSSAPPSKRAKRRPVAMATSQSSSASPGRGVSRSTAMTPDRRSYSCCDSMPRQQKAALQQEEARRPEF
eukprot:8631687-Alexandrium_andersonii.AAC.1